MCGRTAQGLAPGEIREKLNETNLKLGEWIDEEKYRTSYNVAPTRYQPAIRAADKGSQGYVFQMMRWGLVPRQKSPSDDYNSIQKSINARDDSLFSGPTGKPMFNYSKNHKRCIVLAEGFYEWRRRGKDRVPFYTKRKDGRLILMASLYDVGKINGVEGPLTSYATITTNASPQLEWLHDRMPVILPYNEDIIKAWLDPKSQWNPKLEAMLKPYDEFLEDGSYSLETYQVAEGVNSVKNDRKEFTVPWNSASNKKTLNRFFAPSAASTKMSQQDVEPKPETIPKITSDMAQDPTDDEDSLFAPDFDETMAQAEAESMRKELKRKHSELAPDLAEETLPTKPIEASKLDDEDARLIMEENDMQIALRLSRQDQEASHGCDITTVSPVESSNKDKDRSSGNNDINAPDDPHDTTMEGEEDELQRVLEISRLQAIADGHDVEVSQAGDVSITMDESVLADETSGVGKDDDGQQQPPPSTLSSSSSVLPSLPTAVPPPPPLQAISESADEAMERREREDIERAIAASLKDTGGSSTSGSTTGSAPPSPSKRRRVSSGTPSTTPKKGGKGGKADLPKITNFFKHL